MKTPIALILAALLPIGEVSARNPQPLRLKNEPSPTFTPVRKVVLVHGFLENGSGFQWMKRRLEAVGVQCLVPKLKPCDGRGGLDKLARDLKSDIERAYGPHEPISIIAFSMGGIVSRIYLQELGGASRCEKLFTISSPHNGTLAAWLYPTRGAADMRPGSELLADLKRTESKLGTMPVVSYRTPLDLIIVPAKSSEWSAR